MTSGIKLIFFKDETDWLSADHAALQQQVSKIQMQLKEKEVKRMKEKLRRQKQDSNQELIRSFVRRNSIQQDARELLQRFVATHHLNITVIETPTACSNTE